MLLPDLEKYVAELRAMSKVCERPRTDIGEKCIQCCEREKIADRLEEILICNGVPKNIIRACDY